MIHRHFATAGLQCVLVDGLPQQVVPGTGRAALRPAGEGTAVDDAGLPCSQPIDKPAGLPQAPETRNVLVAHLHRDAVQLAEGAHRLQVFPLARDHRAPRPVPIQCERSEALKLRHHGLRLRDRTTAGRQDLHAPLCDRIALLPSTARRFFRARLVDVDGMPGLHALLRRYDHCVGGCDDVACGPVVTNEIAGLRPVVLLEAADELDRCAVEGVDVLVVVAYREQRELAGLVLKCAPGQGRDKFVLVGADVLILVHEDPAKACQQTLPLLVGFLG